MIRGRFNGPMALMGLVLAVVMWTCIASAAMAQQPTLVVEPNKGTYGLQIFLKGTGFAPNSQVQIEAFGQTIAPQSDSAGAFLVIAYAPTDQAKYKPGSFNVTAKDTAGHTAKAAFQLEELVATVRPGDGAAEAATAAPPAEQSPAGALGSNMTWLVVVVAGVIALAILVFAVVILGRRRAAPPRSPESAQPPRRPATPQRARPPEPAAAPAAAPPPVSSSETTLVMPAVPKLSSRPTLQVVSGDGAGTVYPLEQKTTVIGRGEDCDIVVNHPMVSRHHAKIVRVGPSYYIHDLQSTNSTLVNGERIDQHVLQPDDEIQVGVTLFMFQQPNPEESS